MEPKNNLGKFSGSIVTGPETIREILETMTIQYELQDEINFLEIEYVRLLDEGLSFEEASKVAKVNYKLKYGK